MHKEQEVISIGLIRRESQEHTPLQIPGDYVAGMKTFEMQNMLLIRMDVHGLFMGEQKNGEKEELSPYLGDHFAMHCHVIVEILRRVDRTGIEEYTLWVSMCFIRLTGKNNSLPSC